MSDIHVLSQDTINKIAAGEVVERPAAVVKEMVENAIDAHANSITVEIKDGGISLIRITDNGRGIKRDDVENAFMPHATSKIRDITDLESVLSLGFRGEALASIDAVSQMEMLTKTAEDFTGTRYTAEGGLNKEITETACPDGTTFIVKNLFFNTPARKKFLKKPATEAGYISDMLERIALSNPEVKIRFINQSQVKLETAGNGDLKDAIFRIYGRETAKNLIEINNENDIMKITGFIGKPSIVRGNRKCMNYFINGRYIQSNVIQKAITESFSSYIMLHKFPFTCLMIDMNPKLTDVNVHPQKMEIRFSDGQSVYSMIYHTLENALKERELIPEVNVSDFRKSNAIIEDVKKQSSIKYKTGKTGLLGAPILNDKKGFGDEVKALSNIAKDIDKDIEKDREIDKVVETSSAIFSDESSAKKGEAEVFKAEDLMEREEISQTQDTKEIIEINEIPPTQEIEETVEAPKPGVYDRLFKEAETEISYKEDEDKKGQLNIFETDKKFMDEKIINETQIIGQVFNTYWIIQYENDMYIVDQHAAHEKVNFERFMAKIKNSSITSQQLEPPIIITLSLREEEYINEHLDEFKELGFVIEPFGGKDYALTGVPENLPEIGAKGLFSEMLDSLLSESNNHKSTDFKMKVATMSCKAAIKGNMRFQRDEMENLLKELMTLENPYNCPHGRPTMVKFEKKDLEKMFKRIVD
ncbi:MAG: DNA mismatch repair endonuclease MutL [Lachnospiraceae bacterium]|nr:DNA mismatch repair endonuclease MutL [Lachnospiraceae bacterium]